MARLARLAPNTAAILALLLTATLIGLTPVNEGRAADTPSKVGLSENPIKPFPAMPELASYETLISLRPEDREHYLQQVRFLLIDLADQARAKGNGTFADSSFELSPLRQILEAVFPQARASESCINEVKDSLGAIYCENGYKTSSGHFVKDESPEAKRHYEAVAHPDLAAREQQANGAGKADKRDQCYPPVLKAKMGANNHNVEYLDYKDEDKACSAMKNDQQRKGRTGACIYAGNVSSYDSRGWCRAPRAVCKDGTIPQGTKCSGGGSPFRCKGSQVVCNPVAFGAKSSTEPHCVDTGGEATRSCEIFHRASQGENAPQKGISAESFLSSGDSNMNQKAWETLRDGFRKLCLQDKSKELARNCGACLVMRRRLIAMNGRVKAAKNKRMSAASPNWACAWSADEDKTLGEIQVKDIKESSSGKIAQ